MLRWDFNYIHMRYADASRVFSFSRQLVVASVILPSDVVLFFFFTHFFRPRSLPGFLGLEYQGLMVHVRKTIGMRREEQKEFGGWCSGLFIFFSLFSIYLFFLYAGIST